MNKAKNIKNWYYLAGPIALVAFICLDFVAGLNYPGYDWANQSFLDLLAQDSYDVILATVFVAITLCLVIAATYSVCQFGKANKKLNGVFTKGLAVMFCAAIVLLLSFTFVRVPNAGSEPYSNQLALEYKTLCEEQADLQDEYNAMVAGDAVEDENGEILATDDQSIADKQTEIDTKVEEASSKLEEWEGYESEPFFAVLNVMQIIVVVMMLVGALMTAIFGFKRGNIKSFAIAAIVCGLATIVPVVFVSLSVVPNIVFTFEGAYGIWFRIYAYAPVLFVAFVSAWIYSYEPVPVKRK